MLRIKRIFKDYTEILANPIPGVHVGIPHEEQSNIWHLNFVFPEDHKYFKNLVLHAVMTFPDNFPDKPPSLRLMTYFIHSHVFQGTQICFSLLDEFREYFEQTNTHHTAYWNALHSSREILEGVYDMLVNDVDKHVTIGKTEISIVMNSAIAFECSVCGHNTNDLPWPLVDVTTQTSSKQILDKLEEQENLKYKAGVFNPWHYSQEIIDYYTCPFTRENITSSENVVLGFGVNVKNGTLITDFELISFTAYQRDGIRTSSGGFNFAHFVPFVINDMHWRRSRGIFQETCNKLVTNNEPLGRRIGLMFLLLYSVFAETKYYSEKHIRMLHEICNMLFTEFKTNKDLNNYIKRYFEADIAKISRPEILIFLTLVQNMDQREEIIQRVLTSHFQTVLTRCLLRNPIMLLVLNGDLQASAELDIERFLTTENSRKEYIPLVMMVFFIRNMTTMSNETMKNSLNEAFSNQTLDGVYKYTGFSVQKLFQETKDKHKPVYEKVPTNSKGVLLIKKCN